MFTKLFLLRANTSILYDSNYKFSYSKASIDRFCIGYHECQWQFVIDHYGESTSIRKQATSDVGS